MIKRGKQPACKSPNKRKRNAEHHYYCYYAGAISVLINMNQGEKKRDKGNGPCHPEVLLQRWIEYASINNLFNQRAGRRGQDGEQEADRERAIY